MKLEGNLRIHFRCVRYDVAVSLVNRDALNTY